MTPAETLAKSKQLDRFLGTAVKEIKAMNKLEELAAQSAALHKAVDDRADRFAARMSALPELIERAFGPQEAKLDELERGADLFEKSLHSMIGHNGGPLPGSQERLPAPQPVIEQPAPEPQPEPVPVVEEKAPEPAPAAEPDPVEIAPPVAVVDPTATGNPPA